MFKAVQMYQVSVSLLWLKKALRQKCLRCRHQKLGEMSPIHSAATLSLMIMPLGISCNCYTISHSGFSSGQMGMVLGSEDCPQSTGTSALVIGGRSWRHKRRPFSSPLCYPKKEAPIADTVDRVGLFIAELRPASIPLSSTLAKKWRLM